MRIFKVGGCVRDALLGIPPQQIKDIDFAVECGSFEEMRDYIIANGGRIFKEDASFVTLRAKFRGVDADFVLCRKERGYSDGRHPDHVEVGTIDDDLARRDFTCNAVALDESGEYYDPHEGIKDIKFGLIRCVGKAEDRFREDSLRMLRAIRFCITKGFKLDKEVERCLENYELVTLLGNVSVERVREELFKAMRHDTLATLKLLARFPFVQDRVFGTKWEGKFLWLEPTLKG